MNSREAASLALKRAEVILSEAESGLPSEMLYDELDAVEALEKATFVLEACRRLMQEEEL